MILCKPSFVVLMMFHNIVLLIVLVALDLNSSPHYINFDVNVSVGELKDQIMSISS